MRLLARFRRESEPTMPQTRLPVWRVYAASVRGASHQAGDVPCQDANHHRMLPDGRLIAVVADGAGSAARSQEGSRLAASAVTVSLCQRLEEASPVRDDEWNETMLDAFDDARGALAELASEEDIPLRELATTLTCAVVAPERLVLAQIGDGVAVARDPEGQLHTTIQPVRGEYANETNFLVAPNARELTTVWCGTQPVRSLVLSTDGLLRLAFQLPSYDPHLPFFAPLLGYIDQLPDDADQQSVDERIAAFLSSDRVNARTDDDKTLLIATRVGMHQPQRAMAVPAAVPTSSRAETTETEAAGATVGEQ